MRISTDPTDPGHATIRALSPKDRKLVSITLNGVRQPNNIITCDDETGYLKRFRLDWRGRVMARPGTKDEPWIEEVRGLVVIELPRKPTEQDHATLAAAAEAKRARRRARNLEHAHV